ncbi:hypothetical protein ACOMHN_054591 [Nucella lapillus]
MLGAIGDPENSLPQEASSIEESSPEAIPVMEDPSAGRVPQDATAQGQNKDRAQPHPESHGAKRMTPKGKPCRILLWLLMFIVGVCSVAGETYPLCDGESVAAAVALQKGNVTIVCPLTADVRQSKQSVVIKYYSPNSTTGEEVLGCDWLSNRQTIDCLPSPFEATLVEIQPDLVIASLPKKRLGNGSYRCQLVPYDRKQPYTDCDICYPEYTTTTPILIIHHHHPYSHNTPPPLFS